MLEKFTIPVTTAADGSFTGFAQQGPARGEIKQVCYTPDPNTPLNSAATIALTGEETGIVIASHGSLGSSAFSRPYMQQIYGTDGTAALYAAAGTKVYAPIVLGGERLKLVISGGGNALIGTFDIYVDRTA